MTAYTRQLFGQESELVARAESVDPIQGLHVPMEGRNPQPERSDQDVRGFVADLFGMDRTYLT